MHHTIACPPTPVPFFDLAGQTESLRAELDRAVEEVVSSCRFVGGPVLDEFANAFAAYCGVEHAVPCSNGTEALKLALMAVLGPGDGTQEVVTVSHTFAATTEAIISAGFKPVFVDVVPDTYLMDLDAVEDACTGRTRAVVPVHLYGQMMDVERLVVLADRRGLAVIEDAAQAHGASFGDVRPGQCSDAASFSFYPGKNLGAWGDAGAVICHDAAVFQRATELADHGRSDKFIHQRVGFNARMDAIQAAVLRVKLDYLDGWNEERRLVARWYNELLGNQPFVVLPTVAPSAHHVYHQYVVQIDDRDSVRKRLSEFGIQTGVHYPIPVHEQPAYRHLSSGPEAFPATHALCRRILSLPVYPGLTRDQVERVAEALTEVTRESTVSRSVAT